MVSHAGLPETSRRTSSVAPRSRSHSHARSYSHSRNRSLQGGAQHAPQNEFPFFAHTGDVEIIISCDGQEKRYLLHRLILAQFSGFFDAGISDGWSRPPAMHELPPGVSTQQTDNILSIIGEETSSSLSAPAVAPEQSLRGPLAKRRWRYELDWEHVEDDEEPVLVQKTPSNGMFMASFVPMPPPPLLPAPHRASPPSAPVRTPFFRSMANLSLGHNGPASQSVANIVRPESIDPMLSNPLLRDYDNLFRIFYNHPPALNATNIASAYSECKALLSLADMYDALAVVGPRIDHHLLRFSSRLFKQIAKYPPSYLKLGYLARSRVIFSEALTHVVGQWPAAYPYLKPSDLPGGGGYEVPLSVLDLIEDKVDELEEIKSRIEAKLFRLTLTTSRGERVNPSNDYLGWLAMSLFRQWLAENTTPEIRGILKNTPNSNSLTNNNGISRPSSANTNSSSVLRTNNNASNNQNPNPVTRQVTQTNTGRIYRLIASPDSQSYLPYEELKRFLKLHPNGSSSGGSASSSSSLYTRDTLKKFERKIEEIKNVARDLVKPLTRNCLELDVRSLMSGDGVSSGRGHAASAGSGHGGLGYLTCMGVSEGEFPWD